MKTMKDINIGLRILMFIGALGLLNLMIFYVYRTAPSESLQWLRLNPVWNYLIIGCANLSGIFAEASIFFPRITKNKEKEKTK